MRCPIHQLDHADDVQCAWCGLNRIPVRTERVDGIEFEVPTWDPTPVEWNESGSWAKDPAATERCLTGIRAAIPNHEELTREALAAEPAEYGSQQCRTYWGSHGCSRPAGHGGLCVCGAGTDELCSAGLKYGDSDTLILWWWSDGGPDRLELSSMRWRWFE